MSRLQRARRLVPGLATHLVAASVLALSVAGPAQAVDIDWVTVGDPGNADDDTGYGAVAYTYRIGKYEVTNAQYTEFLNAVAAGDLYGSYNGNMGYGLGGITRSGSWGSYTYSAIAGRESWPVNYVSFYDALRFANWLHNGQPTGWQNSSTTEDGAYTMITEGPYPDGPFITRNADATVFLTSEDEWYKAAYYAGSGTYYDYPAGSDTQTTCAAPGATANTANCDEDGWPPDRDLTDAGSYTGSASPSGTFDQGGNVWEWNEGLSISSRGWRGGSFTHPPYYLGVLWGSYGLPEGEGDLLGFRVASRDPPPLVPSVSPVGMAMLGGLVFAIAVGGLAVQRRRRRGAAAD
jgi:formylglycine-generating enzyme required for sulfatase activity